MRIEVENVSHNHPRCRASKFLRFPGQAVVGFLILRPLLVGSVKH